MLDIILRNVKNAAEVRVVEKGKFELVKLQDMTNGKATYKPGWKWYQDGSPYAGTEF